MSNLSSLTSAQLKRAAELKEQLEALAAELAGLLENGDATVVAEPARKGKFSAAGLARLRAAQKARWAKIKAAKGDKKVSVEKKSRRKMSAAGRAKIAAGARARWARFHAAQAGK
jgi:hypothetical protein